MRRIIILAIGMVVMLAFAGSTTFAQSEKPGSKEDEAVWQEILEPGNLMDFETFLNGRYRTVFYEKIWEALQNKALQKRYGDTLKGTETFDSVPTPSVIDKLDSESKLFVYGAYVYKWHLAIMEKQEVDEHKEINGKSEKWRGRRSDLASNTPFIEAMNKWGAPPQMLTTPVHEMLEMGRVPGLITPGAPMAPLDSRSPQQTFLMSDTNLFIESVEYFPQLNILVFEQRMQLPAALWMKIIVEGTRFPYWDIIKHKNSPPKEREKLVEMTTGALLAGQFIWKIVRSEFMEAWVKERVGERQEYIFAKLILLNTLYVEREFNESPEGNLEEIRRLVRKMFYQ